MATRNRESIMPAPGIDRDPRDPLAHADWAYVSGATMDELTPVDWIVLERQRVIYRAEQQARQVLELFAASRDAPTFGYPINNYRHGLQAATLALRDGQDEETIVVSLLHDIGFVVCPETHAQFAAALLGSYISERNHWMLLRHPLFQNIHVHGHPDSGFDRHACERWRGHPHFEWTAEWVARYDQNALDPDYDCLPLDAFEPLVRRLFARTPQPKPLDIE